MSKISKVLLVGVLSSFVAFLMPQNSAEASNTFTVNVFDVDDNAGQILSLQDTLLLSALSGPADFTGQFTQIDFADDGERPGLFFVNDRGFQDFPGDLQSTFGVTADGTFRVDESDTYTFLLRHDDGASLTINGQEIVNFNGLTSERSTFGSIFLNAGVHNLSALFFENLGQATFEIALAQGITQDSTNFRLVSAVSSIPEPATWLMMIIGFALVGVMVKRRQSFRTA